MKTTYRQRSSKKHLLKSIFWAILVFAILWGLKFPLTHFVRFTVTPFLSYIESTESSTGKIIAYLKWKSSLQEEIEKLKKENFELQNQLLLMPMIQDENTELKELYSRSPKEDFVLGRVLLRPMFTPFDIILIDVGSDDGVKEGARVWTEQSYVGTLIEVGDNSSRVRLYSSPGEEIAVGFGSTEEQFKAIGKGGGNFEVVVPKEIPISIGDNIIVPSFDTSIFSKVAFIDEEDSDAFKTIRFQGPFNWRDMKWVLIEK